MKECLWQPKKLRIEEMDLVFVMTRSEKSRSRLLEAIYTCWLLAGIASFQQLTRKRLIQPSLVSAVTYVPLHDIARLCLPHHLHIVYSCRDVLFVKWKNELENSSPVSACAQYFPPLDQPTSISVSIDS